MTVPSDYAIWALRHPQAAAELAALLTPPVATVSGAPGSEARVQSEIRLEAVERGCRLYRNNSGALIDETGRLVRFGLGNESKQLNDVLKFGDLVGWRRVLITPAMVGTEIAQFLMRECKPPQWRLLPSDKRGHAQAAACALVRREGGDACFATGVGTL